MHTRSQKTGIIALYTLMLQPGQAPGRAATGAPPPAAPPPQTGTATATPADGAPPKGGSSGGFGGMMMLLPFLLLFGLIFLMNRSDKKKRAALESQLKKGDRVITRSGLIGKLIENGVRTVRIEIAPGVNVSMLKSAVEGLDTGDPAATNVKADAKGKPEQSKEAGSKKKKR